MQITEFNSGLLMAVVYLPLAHAQTLVYPITHLNGFSRNANNAPVTGRIATPLEKTFMPRFAQSAKTAESYAEADPSLRFFDAPPYYPAQPDTACATLPGNCAISVPVTADFDGDGMPDIADVQYNATLNLLLNDGSGGFKAPTVNSSAANASSSVQVAAAVDINGDGRPDILALDLGRNQILVFVNIGSGFAAATSIPIPQVNGAQPASFVVADFNRDGKPDIVVSGSVASSSASTVVLQAFLGNGDGTFAVPTPQLTTTLNLTGEAMAAVSNGIAVADFNGDGKADLAVELIEPISKTSGQIAVTLATGNGDGSFSNFGAYNPLVITATATTQLVLTTPGVYAVDLNGDGIPDLVSGASGTTKSVLGNGDGNFQQPVIAIDFPDNSYGFIFQDLNGDGELDLIANGNFVSIFSGNGDGTFGAPLNTYSSPDIIGMTMADYNADGKPDLAFTGSAYGKTSVLFGEEGGGFAGVPVAPPPASPPGGAPTSLKLQVAADLNADGRTDLVAVNIAGNQTQLISALNTGAGKFTYVDALPQAQTSTLAYVQPVTADFNGDGKQDLLITTVNGNFSAMAVALGNGDGTFQAPVALALPSDLQCLINYAAVGDLNGDGKPDVVVAYPGDVSCGKGTHNPAGYFVALGNGDGTFAQPVFTAYGSELYSVNFADLNHDGKLDLILDDAPFHVAGNYAVYDALGNGDGTFQTPMTVEQGLMVSQILPYDFDGDGNVGLILLCEGGENDPSPYATAGIQLYQGNGDGTFTEGGALITGKFFLSGVIMDATGNGPRDIVAAYYSGVDPRSGPLGITTFPGVAGGFGAPVSAMLSNAPSLVTAASIYGRGKHDVIAASGAGIPLLANRTSSNR